MSIIIENIKQCREALAVKIKELQDSKKKAIKEKRLQDSKNGAITENKLTSVFIFLGELLQNNKTDAELKIKITEKIQSNNSAIDGFCELLIKKFNPEADKMISEITRENNLYSSLLTVNEEVNSESQNIIVSNK